MTQEADSKTMRVEARLAGGLYALNRFLLTLQNKRMPLGELTVEMGREETRLGFTLECEREKARRYVILLDNLEDSREVGEIGEVGESAERESETYEKFERGE